jgi:hypothetical protein
VTARLDTLGDDQITPGGLRGSRFPCRPNLPGHERSYGVSGIDEVRVRLAPEELRNSQAMDTVDDLGQVGQVRDQKALAEAGARLGQANPTGHHAQAARPLHRPGKSLSADTAESGELKWQAAADELGESRPHDGLL